MKKPFLILFILIFFGAFAPGISPLYAAERVLSTEFKVETQKSSNPSTESTAESLAESKGDLSAREEIPHLEKGPSGPGLQLGVKDCIQMALLNNREIKASDYDIEVAKWKLKEAQPRGLPVFEYEFLSAPAPRNVDEAVKSLFEGDVTFFQKGKIGVGFPLYSFGKINLAQELATAGIEAEKEKKVDKQNDVILKVQKLYYGLLLAGDLLNVLEDADKHMVNEISRREAEGQTTDPIELVRLKLFRYEIVNRIDEAEKKSFLAKEGLRIQMGLEKGTTFELTDDHLRPVEYDLKDFDTYLEMARKYRPEVQLLQIGLHAKEALHRLEKRKIAPNVGVGGFYEFGRTTNSITGLNLTDDFNNPFNFDRVGFGLRVNGEINVKSYQAKVHQAQAEYFKTAMGKQVADEGLELDLKESYLGVFQSRKRMENNYRAMKLARQFVFLTKTNIDIGVGDKKDYSDALQAYLIARGRYMESVYDYNISVATLKQKVGGVAQQE